MKVTVVGCSGSFPGPTGPASCYLVEVDGYRVVLDLGNGSVGALQQYLDLAPHWAIFPGLLIFLAVLSINYIGDGLRDALDPRKTQ